MLLTAAAVITANVPATSGSACNERANSLNCPARAAGPAPPELVSPRRSSSTLTTETIEQRADALLR